jgi:hypothetical protein
VRSGLAALGGWESGKTIGRSTLAPSSGTAFSSNNPHWAETPEEHVAPGRLEHGVEGNASGLVMPEPDTASKGWA